MRINTLEIFNFGSYEGLIKFNTSGTEDKNIVLIGGKNGAGKTTLFTAIRLCLYGYMSLGYKSINANYIKLIKRKINNTAKLKRPTKSYVKCILGISNGQEMDSYELVRLWQLDKSLEEKFLVKKNGQLLNEEERGDFEKYLLNLIPPELFNLYFFDGEKIAEFFLSEGNNVRIKKAFLTLCGYDTFEIMSKNFKRISSNSSKNSALNSYLISKEKYINDSAELTGISNSIVMLNDQIADCESSLKAIEDKYKKKGGLTDEEWQHKLDGLKEEERKREELNLWLKKQANDIIPFLMIKDQVVALDNQIRNEENDKKIKAFDDILSNQSIVDAVSSSYKGSATDLFESIKKAAHLVFKTENKEILNLSYDQQIKVSFVVDIVLNFDEDGIIKAKKDLKKSLNRSAKLRSELERSNISFVNDYLITKAELLNEKSKLQGELISELEKLAQQEKIVKTSELEFRRLKKEFESEIKQSSINDIAAKAILMLDKLQEDLYSSQVKKVEKIFVEKMTKLMRKDAFIDDVKIDENFNVILYKNKPYSSTDIEDLLKQYSIAELKDILGERAANIIEIKQGNRKKECILPVEIDKNGLSAGEKQIFIMSLYFSLIELCKNDVPFVIDTPFARIDKGHRSNIAKEFFCKLKGQVFIFSTDEEINENHMKIMEDKIAVTYLLENTDNKRTIVNENKFF